MEENYLIDIVYNRSEIKAKISTLSAASHALFSLSELSLATLSAVINWMHEVRDRHGVFCVNHWSLWCKRGGSSWDDVYSWAWVPQLMIELKFKELITRDSEAEQRLKMVLKSRARAHSSACITCNCTMLSTPSYRAKQRALWPWTKKECAEVDAEIHAWKKWLSLSLTTLRVDFRSDKIQKLSKSLQVGREEQLNWIELTAMLVFFFAWKYTQETATKNKTKEMENFVNAIFPFLRLELIAPRRWITWRLSLVVCCLVLKTVLHFIASCSIH